MKKPRILLPLDFSENSAFAINAAKQIAQLFEGTITPFHAYMPVTGLYSPGMYGLETMPFHTADPKQMEDVYEQNLKDIINNNLPAELVNNYLTKIGKPDQAIVAAAKDFDIIVMGSHGRSGFSRLLMGSTSDKVLRTAHIPVLVVNKEQQLNQLKSIMVLTDFSDYSKEAFPITVQMAQTTGAGVELVHVLSFNAHEANEPDESIKEMRQQRLQIMAKEYFHELGDKISSRLIISSQSPHEAIMNDNLNNPHDLIIMATVGRTGIEYLMMGGTASRVVQHVKSPVLSINPKTNLKDK